MPPTPRGYRGYIGAPTGEYIMNFIGFFEKYIFDVFRGFWTSHGRFGPWEAFRKHWGYMALPSGKAYFFKGEPLNGKAHFLNGSSCEGASPRDTWEPLQGILQDQQRIHKGFCVINGGSIKGSEGLMVNQLRALRDYLWRNLGL